MCEAMIRAARVVGIVGREEVGRSMTVSLELLSSFRFLPQVKERKVEINFGFKSETNDRARNKFQPASAGSLFLHSEIGVRSTGRENS